MGKKGEQTISTILLRTGIILFIIGLATFLLVFYLAKKEIHDRQENAVDSITEMIKQAIEITDESTKAFEHLVDLRLYSVSKAIAEELKGKKAENVTAEELKKIKDKWGLYDISLLVKKGEDLPVVQSSDPREIGLNAKDWGYWYTAINQLIAGKEVTVGKGYYMKNFWAGPLSKSEIYDKHFKYAYYYDGTTEFVINPFVAAEDIYKFTMYKSGPIQLIEKVENSTPGIVEIAVINIEAYLKGDKNEIIEPRTDLPVLYGKHSIKLDEDSKFFKQSLQTKIKSSVCFEKDGMEYEKIYISLPEKRILTIVMSKAEEKKVERQLFWLFLGVYSIAFVSNYLIAKMANRKSLKLLKTDKEKLKAAQYLAYYDHLTNLPNRAMFHEYMEEQLRKAKEGEKFALLFIDLDNFKTINDSLGHEMGDQLLIEAAHRLRNSISQNALIARMGGDEFTLLLPDIKSRRDAELISQRIIDMLKKPFLLCGREWYITTSIGISIYPNDGTDLKTLLINADMAMYDAKNKGKNNYSFFAPDINIS